MNGVADGLLWYAVFLFSLSFHEGAHALLALRLGDRTAYEGGQVTLNPLPHVRREPFGTVVVPLLSFALGGWMIGWASTPYDPLWALRYPKRSALMSLAGPAANLVLVLVAGVLVRVGLSAGFFVRPELVGFSRVVDPAAGGFFAPLAALVSVLFSLNLLLALFNLMPVPPFDGSGVLALVLPEGAARQLQVLVRHPAVSLIGLLVVWRFFGVVFAPLYRYALHLLLF